MKVLQINNNLGEFSTDGTNYNSIKDITKENLKQIVELVLFNDDIDYDDLTSPEDIKNPVEKIIYENILSKIKSLITNKTSIISTTYNNYADLYEKYNLQRFEN